MAHRLLKLSYVYLSKEDYNKFTVKFTRLSSKLNRRKIYVRDIYILIEYLFELVTVGKKKFVDLIFQEICFLSLLSLKNDLSFINITKIVGYVSKIPCISTLKKIFIKYNEVVSFPLICIIESLYKLSESDTGRYFMLKTLRNHATSLEIWTKFYDLEYKIDTCENIFLQMILDNSKSFLNPENHRILLEHTINSKKN
jgi:hypothetical protein